MGNRIDVKKIYDPNEKWFWVDYDPMLKAFGKIVIQVDDHDYQGDSRLLYDEYGRIGYLMFGWGSCSGCDALQACDTIDEVQELCDELQDSIKWFDDKKSALEWFENHDWEGDFSYHDENTKKFIQMAKIYLLEEK